MKATVLLTALLAATALTLAMSPFIERFKSLTETIAEFGRL